MSGAGSHLGRPLTASDYVRGVVGFCGRPVGSGRCSSAHRSISPWRHTGPAATRPSGSGKSGRFTYRDTVLRLTPSKAAASSGPTSLSFEAMAPGEPTSGPGRNLAQDVTGYQNPLSSNVSSRETAFMRLTRVHLRHVRLRGDGGA